MLENEQAKERINDQQLDNQQMLHLLRNLQQPVVNIVNTNTNANVNPQQSSIVIKSKTTALVLCIFLGWLGIHRFYVGKNFTGLVYLFTCGLFGFGIVIDLILIMAGGFRDKSGSSLQ